MTEPDQAHSDSGESLGDQPRRRRLLFRATHRGTQENDLLIGNFVRTHLETLTDADVEALEILLERPDPDLADWLTGRRPIAPEDATPMLLRIRASLVR